MPSTATFCNDPGTKYIYNPPKKPFPMQTERFNRLRRDTLDKIFSKTTIVDVWRKIVREQTRNFDLKDLFDNYDFNYNIEDRASAIRSEILKGTYKIGQPMIYRIEKKFGVCRHLVIPQPSDSLVLQVLVEAVAANILLNQPSQNAFYSRDKHNGFRTSEFDEYGLSFRQQWKMLQKKIYKFNEARLLIVVTDLSNYYDSIDIKELRKVFTSYAKIEEVLIDLLFRLIEEISWKPDYLPYSGRGLPTTNIEGVRLLAHSFLFEIDEVLKQKTKNNFTRWMDDIVIGLDERKEAIETISSVSDMLKTRGLSLNMAKTDIYDQEKGYYHFQIEANRYIDSIENISQKDLEFPIVSAQLYRKFKAHFKDKNPKYWDKIAKRYITTLGRFQSLRLLNDLPEIYLLYPSLRRNLLYYLSKIGYSKKTAENVILILEGIDIFDDISLYQVCDLVTLWEIPVNDNTREFLKKVENLILKFSFRKKIPSHFYSVIWFKAKYSHCEDLLNFIKTYENIWQTDTFLRRQVTAIFTRLLIYDREHTRKYLKSQITSGISNTVTVATQILQFSAIMHLDKKLLTYLFPLKRQSTYPLAKFLILCSVLNSKHIRANENIKAKCKEWITDPYYLKWLDSQYNIN